MDRHSPLKQILPHVALCYYFSQLLVVSFIQVSTAATSSQSADLHVPAMYVFGDSLADVGNLKYVQGKGVFADFPPYGVDYPGGVPTGRFCNGYIFVDFLAMKMGFKESPPPSLAVMNNGEGNPPSASDFRGLNFAAGGAGISDSTGGNNVTIPLGTQVNLFAKVVAWLVAAKGKPAAAAELSRSPVIISAGGNDLAVYMLPTFLPSANSSRSSSSLQPPDVVVSSLVAAYRVQLQRIYHLGARKFVFAAVPNLGCAPGLRDLAGNGSCVGRVNAVSGMFNKALQDMLGQGLADDYEHRFPTDDFEYSIIDTYEIMSAVTANPLRYGMTNVNRACCELGVLKEGGLCTSNFTTFCSDRAQHLFWDLSHPSQAASKLIADYGFSGPPKFAHPVNIAQLLHLDD